MLIPKVQEPSPLGNGEHERDGGAISDQEPAKDWFVDDRNGLKMRETFITLAKEPL
jgi:hypothetical protein